MPRSSSYNMPSEWTNRRSESYHQLPKNHDPQFNCKIVFTVVLHFVVNLMLSGVWLGIVFGTWMNWGGEYRRFNVTKEHDCNLMKYFGIARKLMNKVIAEDFQRVIWTEHGNHAVPESDNLYVPESGVYVVTSVISFYCNSSSNSYNFEQVLDSSRGSGVKDRMDLVNSHLRPIVTSYVCHRSYLYAVFDLQKGDSIFVNIRTPLSIKYSASYISYYRIRDPLRCPRKINKQNDVKGHETVRTSREFFGQKIFKDSRYWWSDAHFMNISCFNGVCKKVSLVGNDF